MDSKKLREEAARLFEQHGLLHWKFDLRRQTGYRLGGCNYRKKTIVVNGFYAEHNGDEMVIDTLLHEIAHALTPGHKHDAVWKAMAVRIGCRPDQHWKKNAVIQLGRYTATCPKCRAVFHKYRRPKYIQGYYCPICGKEHGRLNFQEQEGGNHADRESSSL